VEVREREKGGNWRAKAGRAPSMNVNEAASLEVHAQFCPSESSNADLCGFKTASVRVLLI